MNYTMTNGEIFIAVSPTGGELYSLVDLTQNNKEYLWEGDETYWNGRAPNLFPIVGRIKNNGTYAYQNKTYHIDSPHGFLRQCKMNLTGHSDNSMEFSLRSNLVTKKQYPFDFEFKVKYIIEKKKLTIQYTIDNLSATETMIFACGAHPGFKVPINSKKNFEDYFIEFLTPATPNQLLLDGAFLTGKKKPYLMENNTTIPLKHELFDNDVILLENASKGLTIKSKRGRNKIVVTYPNFKYIGIWHTNQSDAPFVCIEPWNGLPSYATDDEILESKAEMTHLPPLQTYCAEFSIEIY